MTLKIDLSPEMETRLKEAASRQNIGEEQYALHVLEKNLSVSAAGSRSGNA